jgi:hypothetical protein
MSQMPSNLSHRILVGKPKEKKYLGRPRHRCVENIKMDFSQMRWAGMAWIVLAQIGTSEVFF